MRIEKRLSKTFRHFAGSGKGGGIVLIACTLISLAVANSLLLHGLRRRAAGPTGARSLR